MRFRWGPPPTDPDFRPDESGWTRLRRPGLAILLFGVVIVFGVAYYYFQGHIQNDWPVWGLALLFFGVLLLHELVHAALFPDHGLSGRTTFGCWAKMGVCYAHYNEAMGHRQFLIALLGPFVVLTGLPLSLNVFLDQWWLRWIALFNGGIALADLTFAVCLLFQAPKAATVKLNGLDIYWKEETQ